MNAAAVASAEAFMALFRLLPVDRPRLYQAVTTPVPLPPAAPSPDFRLPPNWGGGTLIDTLA
jgi:hypothetical protein